MNKDILVRMQIAAFIAAIKREIEYSRHTYIIWDGAMVPLTQDRMALVGLTNGQVVTDEKFHEIEQHVIESINDMIIEWELRRRFGDGARDSII